MRHRLRNRILSFFDPSRSIPLFIVGTAALSLVLTAAYDYANAPGAWQGGYWLALGALALVLLILLAGAVRRGTAGRVGIREEQQPGKRAGLVVLLGPTEASAPAAIEYHLPALQHCWLIATPQALKTAAALAERYHTRIRHVHWGEPRYLVDPDQIQSTYNLVVRIFDEEAVAAGLETGAVIADITGGMKPMTAGMALACLARNREMQYMKAPRDPSGQIVEGAEPVPIRIDATFVPALGVPPGRG